MDAKAPEMPFKIVVTEIAATIVFAPDFHCGLGSCGLDLGVESVGIGDNDIWRTGRWRIPAVDLRGLARHGNEEPE
jgi:hypothetical protein